VTDPSANGGQGSPATIVGSSPDPEAGAAGPSSEVRALDVHDVTVTFGGLRALSHVNLAAGRGEIVGLIGPNGAGKTTLLNVITGLIRPDAGKVTIAGRTCNRLSVHRRARLGLARPFQRVTLFAELSVREHIQLAAEARVGMLHRTSTAGGPDTNTHAWNTEAETLVRRLGLHVGTEASVTGLPLGNARLMELAMALASQPRVLLLDEPFSGLAASERDHLRQLLQDVRDETNVAIVLVEHDVDIVSRIADRIVVLDFGQVIGDGKPQAVLADPVVRQAYFGMAGIAEV
jgi:branched-chain amino acid transport system ATP-binding protein